MNVPTLSFDSARNYCACAVGLLALALFATPAMAAVPSFTITPSAVSNGYTGFITLQINGLTNGETVKISKYLDVNANGVVDSGDMLVQAFSLTDGQASLIGGATNVNVPGDATPADGAITARLSFLTGGFDQQLVGNYAFRVSSPYNNFTPMTNWFQVTNAGLAQSFSGSVMCSGTNLPNAVVMLFTPPSGDGGMTPVGGAIANSGGSYRLEAPVGTYMLWSFKSNFVADLTSAPVLSIGSGATINTNLTLLPATQTISGRVVDAANTNIPLKGLSVFWMSTNNAISSGFTDTNGNFTVGATAGEWQFGGDDQVFTFLGYLAVKNAATVYTGTGSVAEVTVTVPKATALIYGSVKDSQNRPIAKVRANASPNNGNGPFQGNGLSDAEGNYAVGVTAGNWHFDVRGEDPSLANYIFSKPFDSTNLNDGQAILANITALVATNHISGHVTNGNGQPVSNIGVFASATINGAIYDQSTRTDPSGFYSLPVANGSWSVGLNCSGGNDSLQSQGYLCVNNQTVNVPGADGIQNFTVLSPSSQVSGYVRDTLSNPIANAGVSVWATGGGFNAYAQTDPAGYYSFATPNGTFNVNVSCGSSSDSLNQLGYLCVQQQTVGVTNSAAAVNFSALAAPYQLSGHVLNSTSGPVANVGVNVDATLNGTPYHFYLQTDATGYYSFRVANGAWSVGLSCGGSPDSLTAQGYLCVNGQNINVSNSNAVANFSVTTAPSQISGTIRDNLGNAITNVGVGAWASINGTNVNAWGNTDNAGHYVLLVQNGSWNVNPSCGGWPGSLDALGYLCVAAQTVNVTNGSAVANFSTIPAPYQVSGYVRDATNHALTNIGVYASATIGGNPYSAYATTDGTGYYHFVAANGAWAMGLDCMALQGQGYACPSQQTNTVAGANLVVNFTVQPPVPLRIITTNLPNATVGVFYSQPLQATGGQPPYSWNFSMGSAPLPPGLNLSMDGTISGTPSGTGTFNFSVHAYDNGPGTDNANQTLSIIVNAASPSVRLSGPTLISNNQIQFSFNTLLGQTYTVQSSTDLTNWSTVVTFGGNGSPITNSFPVNAAESRRLYRVKIGPP